MKEVSLAIALALTLGSGSAFAAVPTCGGTAVLTGTGMATEVKGYMVCVGSAGAWDNQEFHQTSGTIQDYKKGPLDPLDPTKTIGTYSINANSTVGVSTSHDTISYTYGSENVGPFMVAVSSGTLYFCNDAAGVHAALFTAKREGNGTAISGCV